MEVSSLPHTTSNQNSHHHHHRHHHHNHYHQQHNNHSNLIHRTIKQHHKQNSILHIRENSLDELEALFDPSKWAFKQQQNKMPPLQKRNLPASFFKPPETGTKTPKSQMSSNSHSRQNSFDQSYVLNNQQAMLNKQHLLLQQKLSNLTNNNSNANNFHMRSMSEPVCVSPLAYGMLPNTHAANVNNQNLINNNMNNNQPNNTNNGLFNNFPVNNIINNCNSSTNGNSSNCASPSLNWRYNNNTNISNSNSNPGIDSQTNFTKYVIFIICLTFDSFSCV
jgi:hypothetical protein